MSSEAKTSEKDVRKDVNKEEYLNYNARRFFASIKNELREQKLEDTLLEKAKNELMLMTLEHDMKTQHENALNIKIKTYGGLVTAGCLLVLILLIVLCVYNAWKQAATVIAVIALVFIIATGIMRASGNALEDKIGKLILVKKYQDDKLNLDDEKINSTYAQYKEKADKLDAEIKAKSSKTRYLSLLPEEYVSLYDLNHAYELGKEDSKRTVADVLAIIKEEELEAEAEQAQQEKEQQELEKFKNDRFGF